MFTSQMNPNHKPLLRPESAVSTFSFVSDRNDIYSDLELKGRVDHEVRKEEIDAELLLEVPVLLYRKELGSVHV